MGYEEIGGEQLSEGLASYTQAANIELGTAAIFASTEFDVSKLTAEPFAYDGQAINGKDFFRLVNLNPAVRDLDVVKDNLVTSMQHLNSKEAQESQFGTILLGAVSASSPTVAYQAATELDHSKFGAEQNLRIFGAMVLDEGLRHESTFVAHPTRLFVVKERLLAFAVEHPGNYGPLNAAAHRKESAGEFLSGNGTVYSRTLAADFAATVRECKPENAIAVATRMGFRFTEAPQALAHVANKANEVH